MKPEKRIVRAFASPYCIAYEVGNNWWNILEVSSGQIICSVESTGSPVHEDNRVIRYVNPHNRVLAMSLVMDIAHLVKRILKVPIIN